MILNPSEITSPEIPKSLLFCRRLTQTKGYIMIPAKKISEQITHTVNALPYEKKKEVYDFALFLKQNKDKINCHEVSKSSLNDLVGIMDGPADLASKHD
jgi:hypothetical protein